MFRAGYPAQGFEIGKSLCERDQVETAKAILKGAGKSAVILPTDVVVAKESIDWPKAR